MTTTETVTLAPCATCKITPRLKGRSYCEPCGRLKENERYRRRASTDPAFVERKRARYDPSQNRAYRLRVAYGLSIEDWNRLYDEQGGRCAICQRLDGDEVQDLHVDHDHKTGVVRGLLCRSCNRGVGYLGDDADRLDAAIEYLMVRGQG